MTLRRLLCFIILLGLAGCDRKVFNDRSVVGPDLGGAGPFAAAHEIVLNESFSRDGARSIDIVHGGAADSATVVNFFSNTDKPYNAGVGYWGFTPVVAETNAGARAYWLMSFNLTRTPDRSVYLILRYPKGLAITSGLSSDDFEYMSVDCGDLDVARHPPDYYAPKKDGETRPEPPLDPAPEAGDCEFNSQHEMQVLTPLVLKKYDQIKHYEDAPEAAWHKVHVEVK